LNVAQSAGAHVAVCTSSDLLESLLCELTAAGRTVIDHPPAAACWPAAAADSTVYVATITADDASTEPWALVTSAARGVSLAVCITPRRLAVDLADQIRRVAPTAWYDSSLRPIVHGLDADQIRLLGALHRGDDVRTAAREAGLSQRTAARRVAAARVTLGEDSTVSAALRVGARLDELRRSPRSV